MNEILTATIQGTGYFQNNIRKNHEQGKVAPNTMEAIFQSRMEDEKKKIQPIYNSRGKLVEYDNSGRRLNILA